MIGNVNPPPGGPADGFGAPACPAACRARAGFYPAGTVPTGYSDVRASAAQTRSPNKARASKIAYCPLTPNMPRSSAAAAADHATYEQALAELEALVQAMEAGKMPLDQLLSSYKRGAELLQQCRARLQTVEDQVKLLEDGQLKPWTAA